MVVGEEFGLEARRVKNFCGGRRWLWEEELLKSLDGGQGVTALFLLVLETAALLWGSVSCCGVQRSRRGLVLGQTK